MENHMTPAAKALQAAADRRAEEWKRIAAEREASNAAIAGDNPNAEINIDKREGRK